MSVQELLIKSTLDVAVDLLKRAFLKAGIPDIPTEAALERHVNQIEQWSRHVQIFVMPHPLDTDSATVPLTIGSIPRRFRSPEGSAEPLNETALLQSESSTVLLGGPGAGKTTTLKRLARHFFVEQARTVEFPWRLPILIRIREIAPDEPIDIAIARALGLPVHSTQHLATPAPGDSEMASRRTKSSASSLQQPEAMNIWIELAELLRRFQIGSQSVGDFVADLLNTSRALVFLDGIDEMPTANQRLMWLSIGNLASRLRNAKILATCRSGDFNVLQVDGFSVCEIEPLTDTQIGEVARAWLPDSAPFERLLPTLPYRDIATRPLFLCFLITVYKNMGRLPEHPRHVYKRIVELALEEWDRSQNLARPSRYATFLSDEKFEFLAQLAYWLTYRRSSRRFSHAELVEVYREICGKFLLPSDEAVEVAHELETHTGIIVDSGFDHYEFSHSSLQEYLCAHYLVRDPFAEKLSAYLQTNPAPIAVATSLSGDPNTWLCALLLNSRDVPFSSSAAESLLARLADERPYFTESELLGFGVLRIIFARGGWSESVGRLLRLPNVKASLTKALRRYGAIQRTNEGKIVLLELIDPSYAPHGFHLQRSGQIYADFYQNLLVDGDATS